MTLIGLRDEFAGFYRPGEAQWQLAYETGTIVFDTNALLDLYRLSPEAREDLFATIEAVRERVFIPYQVASEFHRRRFDAVADRRDEFGKIRSELDQTLAKAKGLIRRAGVRAHGDEARGADAMAKLETSFTEAKDFLDAAAEEYDLDPDTMLTGERDSVLLRLETILKGRVAPRPDEEMLDGDLAEGKRRADAKIPPGYKDASKPENQYGDYLWWAELLRHAKDSGAPILIVSNDVAKGDWTYEVRGLRVGPDPLLIDEVRGAGCVGLAMCTTAEFLRDASRFLKLNVSEAAIAETQSLPNRDDDAIRNVVPIDWVPRLTGVEADRISGLHEVGLVPDPEDETWRWQDVRKLALLKQLANEGQTAEIAVRILAALDERPSGFNFLVLQDDQHLWVRNRDSKETLDSLEAPPLYTMNWQKTEKKLRIIQSQLKREVALEDDADND